MPRFSGDPGYGGFDRFTERARRAVVLAQDEARALRHDYIGTEHVLLGLLREEEGVGARVLDSLDVTVEEVRAQVARIVGTGEEETTGEVPFTPRAKRVLELALREALSFGHHYIGTEHVLLGLAREDRGVAARILVDLGADEERIRAQVVSLLTGTGRPSELARVRREKEQAIEAGDWELAAALREQERALLPVAPGGPRSSVRLQVSGPSEPRRAVDVVALVAGWLAFGLPFGLGLLVAWLIWG